MRLGGLLSLRKVLRRHNGHKCEGKWLRSVAHKAAQAAYIGPYDGGKWIVRDGAGAAWVL